MTNSTEFPRGFPRKLEGVVGKRAGNTERKPGRVREETLGKAKGFFFVSLAEASLAEASVAEASVAEALKDGLGRGEGRAEGEGKPWARAAGTRGQSASASAITRFLAPNNPNTHTSFLVSC